MSVSVFLNISFIKPYFSVVCYALRALFTKSNQIDSSIKIKVKSTDLTLIETWVSYSPTKIKLKSVDSRFDFDRRIKQ